MINRPSIYFDLIPHKFGQKAKILPSVSTAYKMLCFSGEGKSFFIRVPSVSHIPASPIFLFRKMIKSISFMENETEEAIKMQNLNKTNNSPFGNRSCLLY